MGGKNVCGAVRLGAGDRAEIKWVSESIQTCLERRVLRLRTRCPQKEQERSWRFGFSTLVDGGLYANTEDQ